MRCGQGWPLWSCFNCCAGVKSVLWTVVYAFMCRLYSFCFCRKSGTKCHCVVRCVVSMLRGLGGVMKGGVKEAGPAKSKQAHHEPHCGHCNCAATLMRHQQGCPHLCHCLASPVRLWTDKAGCAQVKLAHGPSWLSALTFCLLLCFWNVLVSANIYIHLHTYTVHTLSPCLVSWSPCHGGASRKLSRNREDARMLFLEIEACSDIMLPCAMVW